MSTESSMSEVRDRDLFVLHSSAERDTRFVVSYLLPTLQVPPARVLLSSSLPPGQRVVAAVERAFSTSRMTLLVLSPEFLRESWTSFGETLASHQAAQGERPLVPLLLSNCELPLRLKMWVSLDLREPNNRAREIHRLREALDHLGPSAKPPAATPPSAQASTPTLTRAPEPPAPRGVLPQLVRLAWARLR